MKAAHGGPHPDSPPYILPAIDAYDTPQRTLSFGGHRDLIRVVSLSHGPLGSVLRAQGHGSSRRAIRRLARRTKAEMAALDEGLIAILREGHPQTVRGVAYRAEACGLIAKTTPNFNAVGRALVRLRKTKVIPFDYIAYNTRWVLKPRTFTSAADALRFWADSYRRAVWADQPVRVEVWVEKDATASLVYQETSRYDVPVMVCRGYPSHSFLYETAESAVAEGKPTVIYYFGDHDPSGLDIQRFIEQTLTGYVTDLTRRGEQPIELRFTRGAVTPYQIRTLQLPTRPTKKTDTRSKGFSGASVDLEAIPARTLREMVRAAIEQYLPPEHLHALLMAEESERDALRAFAVDAGGVA